MSSEEKNYKCDYCSGCFVEEYDFLEHVRILHQSHQISCKLCCSKEHKKCVHEGKLQDTSNYDNENDTHFDVRVSFAEYNEDVEKQNSKYYFKFSGPLFIIFCFSSIGFR